MKSGVSPALPLAPIHISAHLSFTKSSQRPSSRALGTLGGHPRLIHIMALVCFGIRANCENPFLFSPHF